ncbi:conserved phage C-terminal domain-containing protein [Streptococcus sp. Marseille-P7375]|uniref:conserved phage C-terminal domain-containing protein n=1 Tax=Streptococcus sp. Marseille-P7375 TaxID=2487318 RepID=UPI0011E8566E|nr:conserved phage C-terminal domain-containing protein [Streptococcus sp. Marseille-P7375]
MAQRRMFSRKITETDRFLEMPLSSQALYFHLNMGADDEGFIDKAKTIQRTIGASDDDMKLLIAKGFLIPFHSGVVVIRHWRIHNYIRSDRFQSTLYQSEKAQLEFDKSKTADLKPLENVIPNGYQMDTQVRLSEGSLDEDSLTTYPTVSDNEEEDIPYKEIISYLNEKANRNYRPNIQKNKTLIKARWSEGFRLDDFKHVIDTTVKDWSGTKYEKYLRPETLFGSKFEGYLNQAPRTKKEIIDERLGF